MTDATPEPDHAAPFRAAIQDLARIPDATDRARAAGAVLNAVPGIQKDLRTVRQQAVIEMRETMGVAETAQALGVAVPRVSQIAKGVSRSSKHAG